MIEDLIEARRGNLQLVFNLIPAVLILIIGILAIAILN